MKLVETQVTSQSISKLSDSSDGVNVHIEPVDSKKLWWLLQNWESASRCRQKKKEAIHHTAVELTDLQLMNKKVEEW